MAKETMIPLLAIAAWSGTGKTTLLKKLIPALCAHGIRPGLIKHTHHDMDVDKPGKDSYELRKAGAAQTLVASQQRWALMTETPGQEELDLAWLVSRMDASKLDLVLVEGFKHEAVAKILLFRQGCGHSEEELILDEHVIAVASDIPLAVAVPVLDLNDVAEPPSGGAGCLMALRLSGLHFYSYHTCKKAHPSGWASSLI
ncbi:molybdopterin-guanine dinucleotide biosynthesis protein MobB [Salmonella enterica subsp. enterica serovar Typhi]|nr:molybdopterin-guanine dinucleotide biosynthesis protein MobB [Salmonella enterica subsp. enterica serovar Typhi]